METSSSDVSTGSQVANILIDDLAKDDTKDGKYDMTKQ